VLLPWLEQGKDRNSIETTEAGMKEWWALMQERGSRRDKPTKPQVVAWELGRCLTRALHVAEVIQMAMCQDSAQLLRAYPEAHAVARAGAGAMFIGDALVRRLVASQSQ
jgi:hypothetical protein